MYTCEMLTKALDYALETTDDAEMLFTNILGINRKVLIENRLYQYLYVIDYKKTVEEDQVELSDNESAALAELCDQTHFSKETVELNGKEFYCYWDNEHCTYLTPKEALCILEDKILFFVLSDKAYSTLKTLFKRVKAECGDD